jgi:hypothetical protein
VSPTGDNPSADGQVTTKPSVTVEEDGYDTDLEIEGLTKTGQMTGRLLEK